MLATARCHRYNCHGIIKQLLAKKADEGVSNGEKAIGASS